MKILLFDIDHTLLYSGGAGIRAFNTACLTVFGTEAGMEGIDLAGKTDPVIVEQVAKNKLGRLPTKHEIEKILAIYINELKTEILRASSEGTIKAGISELLEILAKRNDIMLGILTGNIQQGAEIKLHAFGLDKYFTFGAFASDDHDRNKLVPIAISRAEKLIGRNLNNGDSVIVIGDTPYDIACARAGNAIAIAVATGHYSLEALRDCHPDLLISDFARDKELFLKFLKPL